MNPETPTLVIHKPKKAPELSVTSKVQFKIKNFVDYKLNENVVGELQIPELGAKCFIEMTPVFDGSGHTRCFVSIKKLCKEFQTPGKYQIETTLTVNGENLLVPQKSAINSRSIRTGSEDLNRDTLISKLDPTGTLVIDVKVTLSVTNTSALPSHIQNANANHKELSDHQNKMLSSPDFADFKFIVAGKEFKVHRILLAAASPIFAKIFATDMQEAKSNEYVVKDVEPEIFEHLLQYIYERKLPENLSTVCMKLFEAAHHYEVNQLKDICLQEVFPLLETDTAEEIFSIANVYNCVDLKNQAWEIIKRDIFEMIRDEKATPSMLQKMVELKKVQLEHKCEDACKSCKPMI